MDPQEIGKRVLERRQVLDLSQEDLAKQSSVSRNYISLIERGLAPNISTVIMSNLAMALGMTVHELMGQTDDARPIPSALRQFSREANLHYDIVEKLAQLPRRGREPKTIEEWRALYEAIRVYIEDGE
jgi:transcriptional regulator with XRE-family HTH domain